MSSLQNNECSGNPEESLANKMHRALDITCEKFISSLKFSRVKNAFRPIYEKHPDELRNLNEQLCSQIKKSVKEEIVQVNKDFEIDELLNSLEAIKKDQDPSQPSWRPSGNPEEDLRDHFYPLKLKHKESLQAELYKLQVENETYVNEATENHAKIMCLRNDSEDLHKQLSDILISFTSNVEDLERTVDNAINQD